MTWSVFVTGARGKTGREVMALLDGRDGIVVRGGSSQSPLSDGTVEFSWDEPSTWRDAVEGVDAIYLMRPDVPNAPELIDQLLVLAPRAHVVLVSEQSAETVADDGWVRRVEAAVTRGAAGWTILRPSWFQQVLTDPRYFLDGIRQERAITLPTGGAPIAWVDIRDIAAVAVEAIVEPDRHHGRALTLTGPEAITLAGVAEAVSSAVGDEVRPYDPPLDQALEGADRWTREVVGEMFGRVRGGTFAEVTGTVEEITGRAARSLGAFIAEHHAQWRVPGAAVRS